MENQTTPMEEDAGREDSSTGTFPILMIRELQPKNGIYSWTDDSEPRAYKMFLYASLVAHLFAPGIHQKAPE